LKTRLALSLSV